MGNILKSSGSVLHLTWNLSKANNKQRSMKTFLVHVSNGFILFYSNDPRLEGLLQNAVRRSLQDMGRRCVQELEKQVRPGS